MTRQAWIEKGDAVSMAGNVFWQASTGRQKIARNGKITMSSANGYFVNGDEGQVFQTRMGIKALQVLFLQIFDNIQLKPICMVAS